MAWSGTPGGVPRPGSPEDEAQKRQQHQALTGVNPGGAGGVSGQANPAAAGGAVPQPLPGPRPPPPPPPTAGQFATQSALFGAPKPAQGEFQTNQGAVTAGPAPSGGIQGAINTHLTPAPPGAPGATGGTGSSGTGSGYGIPGISSVPGIGGTFTTSTADLGPVHAAQNADFNAAQALNQERYDYRPGESPYQERVQLNTMDADQTRAQQQQAIQALQAAAAGTAPSVAELQLRQQADRNNANAFGAASALRGRSPGSSFLAASRQNAANQIDTNANAAMVRASEMERARAALTGALSGVRGQDVDTSQANAGLAQSANQNNLNSQIQANAQSQAWKETLLKGQLAAMGYGTEAAGAGVGAAAKNAEAENATKDTVVGGITKKLGL